MSSLLILVAFIIFWANVDAIHKGQLSGSESVKSEDEANEVDVARNSCEPELSVLDEILSVEAKSIFNETDDDGEKNPEVIICKVEVYRNSNI